MKQTTISKKQKPQFALISYTDLTPTTVLRRNTTNHILQECNGDYTYKTAVINFSEVETYEAMEADRAIMDLRVLRVFRDNTNKTYIEELVLNIQEEEQDLEEAIMEGKVEGEAYEGE